MPDHTAKPLHGSYWVLPDQLLAGPYPSAFDEDLAQKRMHALVEAGVTTIIDLTESDEHRSYVPRLNVEAAAQGRVIEHHRYPIPDMDVPLPEQMVRILDAIDTALGEGQVVYVHCMGGIGRTGTVIGCFLVRHGQTGAEALQEIARLRGGLAESPETEEQRRMIRTWKE
jgi:protein-tyrosine phosphatase